MIDRAKRALRLATDKRYRRWIALSVLILTALLVINFFVGHPEYVTRLRSVSPSVIVIIILLNIPSMAALAWAYDAILRLCGKPIGVKENVLLTAYSSIINFFGPLQSGPGVRAAYLKTRHKVRIRDYMFATLIYYAFFAMISAFFLLVGMRPWWQTALAVIGAAGFSVVVIKWFSGRRTSDESSGFRLRPHVLVMLGIAVFLQVAFIAAYYYVELKAVNPSIHVNQVISYSGAANFALFVSLTPDAVGFREAFLIFSQHIHHVSTADIVNANIIDRGAYVIYLGLLFLLTLGVHARDRLHLKQWRERAITTDQK
jgi:uncharacterized membrane protein YbhN (UPF0104 family)